LVSVVTKKLFAAVDGAVPVAIKAEKGIGRTGSGPRELLRAARAPDVEFDAVSGIGEEESKAVNIDQDG
jgi:hypothetical protein